MVFNFFLVKIPDALNQNGWSNVINGADIFIFLAWSYIKSSVESVGDRSIIGKRRTSHCRNSTSFL